MSPVTHFFCYDANGNSTGVVDTNGFPAVRYSYDPFGHFLSASGDQQAALQNSFRFSTKYTDLETGLVYFGYRWYDPVTGR